MGEGSETAPSVRRCVVEAGKYTGQCILIGRGGDEEYDML